MMRKFKRIDLTNATEDYFLKVGEEAYISFSNVTQVPLRIATQDGTYYEMHVIGSNTLAFPSWQNTSILLAPNNTAYTGEFVHALFYRSGPGFYSSYATNQNYFFLGAGYTSATVYITNRLNYKNVRVIQDLYGMSEYGPLMHLVSADWRNTTTPWTSLGTIIYTWSASGEILVRRLK